MFILEQGAKMRNPILGWTPRWGTGIGGVQPGLGPPARG